MSEEREDLPLAASTPTDDSSSAADIELQEVIANLKTQQYAHMEGGSLALSCEHRLAFCLSVCALLATMLVMILNMDSRALAHLFGEDTWLKVGDPRIQYLGRFDTTTVSSRTLLAQ